MHYYAGIDVGSLATKCAIVDESGNLVSQGIVATGARVVTAAEAALKLAADSGGVDLGSIGFRIATGYGRKRVEADHQVTEITCHAMGAVRLFPGTRTIIDIGGQDTKVIRVSSNGEVENFVMNDKCAAGTGRFLEVMARALEVDVEELGPLALTSEQPQKISSFCTVFGESEVVSHVADGAASADIARGIHESVAHRVTGLVKRVGVMNELTMSGGVARNVGMRTALSAALSTSLNFNDNSQVMGALGAALIAREKHQRGHDSENPK